MHGFMSTGATRIQKKALPIGLMGTGAIPQERKQVTEKVQVSEVAEVVEAPQAETDLAKLPFFTLKAMAVKAGYQGEMKKQPILDFLQSKSLNNER